MDLRTKGTKDQRIKGLKDKRTKGPKDQRTKCFFQKNLLSIALHLRDMYVLVCFVLWYYLDSMIILKGILAVPV